MARLAYSLLLYLITPLICLRLLWRGRKQPAYWQNLGERYGFYRQPAPSKLIWVHAVSVGETRAAQPLIEGLLARWPDHRILLTGMTPTGREAGREVYGERVIQVYLPYDYPGAVRRFFRHFRPAFGVLMETENLAESALFCPAGRGASDPGQRPFVGSFGPGLRSLSWAGRPGLFRLVRCRGPDGGRC